MNDIRPSLRDLKISILTSSDRTKCSTFDAEGRETKCKFFKRYEPAGYLPKELSIGERCCCHLFNKNIEMVEGGKVTPRLAECIDSEINYPVNIL
jgi:hypothetical protein